MNTLVIIPLIVPTLIILMLISLIIKERGNLFPTDLFSKNKQGNSYKRQSVQENKHFKNSSDDSGNFLDFSGGVLGI